MDQARENCGVVVEKRNEISNSINWVEISD
jgi:hypothetical protein